MTLDDIEKIVRSEISDEAGHDKIRRVKSWQIIEYANEAEIEACIRARLLVDSTTTDICTIPVVAGTTVYDYDQRIVLILRGRISGSGNTLKRVSFSVMDENYPKWQEQTGEIEAFVTGMDKGKIRLFRNPTSTSASQLNITVVRIPLNRLENSGDTPEIPERMHPALIYWIKHKIYNNQHSELFDKNRADVHLDMFEQKFGKRTDELNDLFDSMQIPQYVPSSHNASHDYCHDYDCY